MKVSLKLEDHHHHQTQTQTQTQTQNPIHFKAKIPISVFGIPFLSGLSATHHHSSPSSDNLSLSLRTHFLSGPSLQLSYHTTPTTTTPPFSLTIKSGVSLFGSPNNSPLIISANFSFSPKNPNPNPNFTIQFKPKLGSFSLRKSISSTVSNVKKVNGDGDGVENVNVNVNVNSYGFVPLDRPNIWKELTADSDAKGGFLSGVLIAADTELPVGRRVKVNLRWGMSVPMEDDKRLLPYLRLNKIKVERVEFDDVKEESVDKKQQQGIEGEFEMLKGMCTWMGRELSGLREENREMRRALEDVKSRQVLRNHNGYNAGVGKKAVGENSDGFEQWRAKKGNVQKETKQNGGSCDVESELQKAIKAASSSQ